MRATLSANSTASVPTWIVDACMSTCSERLAAAAPPTKPAGGRSGSVARHATPRRARITMHVTARSKNMRSLTVEAQLEYFTLVGPGYDLFELC